MVPLSGDTTIFLNKEGLVFTFHGGFIWLPSDLGANSSVHVFLAKSERLNIIVFYHHSSFMIPFPKEIILIILDVNITYLRETHTVIYSHIIQNFRASFCHLFCNIFSCKLYVCVCVGECQYHVILISEIKLAYKTTLSNTLFISLVLTI